MTAQLITSEGRLDSILERPWALELSALRALAAGDFAALARRPEPPRTAGTVTVIPIMGAITHRADFLNELLGGTSVESVRTAFRAAIADRSVSAVVLQFDSPGGDVSGITELANEIRAARGRDKPIIAVADGYAASAAYWLASQADRLYASPSSTVGAIGIFGIHADVSKALEDQGVKITVVSAGPRKTEGNPYEPLSDSARAEMQSRADSFYAQFVGDVARGRRVSQDVVRSSYGEGAPVLAKVAAAAGMVDGIMTLDQAIGTLAPGQTAQPAQQPGFGGEMFTPDGLSDILTPAAAAAALTAGPVAPHGTSTDDGAWDAAANEGRLPSPMTVATARRAYAWIDDAAVDNGEVPKSGCRFIHHEVSANGSPGAANLTACSAGIAVLNGGRGGTTIPGADRQGVYDHLARHLRDADREPPALRGEDDGDDMPTFTERVEALAAESAALASAAGHRARSRAAEGRPAFSTTTERALRESRDALTALLETGEPVQPPRDPEAAGEPPPAAGPVQPAKPATPRFHSTEEWVAFMQRR